MCVNRLVRGFLAAAVMGVAGCAPMQVVQAGQDVDVVNRAGVALIPSGAVPAAGQALTLAFWDCEAGRQGFLYMQALARVGAHPETGLAALLRGDTKGVAAALEYHLQVDNVRGSLQTKLTVPAGGRTVALEEGQGMAQLAAQHSLLAMRCRADASAASAHRQLDAVQAALARAVRLQAGRAASEFSSRDAAFARFRELSQAGQGERDASHAQSSAGGKDAPHERESVSWVLPERDVTLVVAGAGNKWRVEVTVQDDRAAKARVAP